MLVKKCLEQKIQNPTFEEYFSLISHEKGTRNNNFLLRLPHVMLEIAKQSFYYGGAKLYKALPLDLRSVQSVVQFRKGLKEFFIIFDILNTHYIFLIFYKSLDVSDY